MFLMKIMVYQWPEVGNAFLFLGGYMQRKLFIFALSLFLLNDGFSDSQAFIWDSITRSSNFRNVHEIS
jgi:hypothetical protein